MQTVAASPATRKPIAYFAHLGAVAGIVLKTRTGAVWFIEDSTKARTLLHPCDAPDIDLHGNVALALRQQRQDGDIYRWVMNRNTEHARVAA